MARSRNIKPSFFTNDVLADCSPLARLLFAGLWTIADREGRLENRPKKIKAEILPYDQCKIEALLSELEKHKFIILYDTHNNNYIQVVNFTKHQNPHIKEAHSTIPAPDKNSSSTNLNRNEPGLNPLTDSLNLIPLTLNPVPGSCSVPNPFAVWYADYPHKVGKAAAEKAFWKAIKKTELENLISGVERYVKTKSEDRPWCNPATWLNEERWEDEPSETKGNENGRSTYDITAEVAAEYYEPEDSPDTNAGSPKLSYIQ